MVLSTPFVKALVRWATSGKMLTNRLPKLSLIAVPGIRHKYVLLV